MNGDNPEVFEDHCVDLSNAVYLATQLVEDLQYRGLVSGSGHHARQKIALAAVDELRSRWIGPTDADSVVAGGKDGI